MLEMPLASLVVMFEWGQLPQMRDDASARIVITRRFSRAGRSPWGIESATLIRFPDQQGVEYGIQKARGEG